jgi:DNA-binding NtrC family response regulator
MRENFQALVDHLMTGAFFLEEAVELLERTMIERTLQRFKGNRGAAAKALGIHRNTLRRKIEQYKLQEEKAPCKPVARAAPAARARSAGKQG